jgi:inorganic pyrophosphatase
MCFPELSGVHLTDSAPPTVEVTIEIPRGSFLKRGSDGHIDFISPLPCPYNYGSIEDYIGGEGDYLDAVVLGPRLPLGSRVQVQAFGSIGMSERFMYDDKLICSRSPLTQTERRRLLRFFHLYAFCKGALNAMRGQRGPSNCEGWGEASAAIARAAPSSQGEQRPQISF